MDASGHLGALLRADPGGALGVPLGGEPPGPRARARAGARSRRRSTRRPRRGRATSRSGRRRAITPTATSERPTTTGAPLRPRASRIPAPQSAAGQISESENPKPRSAIAPAIARATKPSSRLRGDGGGPLSGASASQAPPYAAIPAPPANASSANVSRTSVASTRRLLAMPAQTPASAPSPSARRRRGSASGSRYGVELNRAALRCCRCRRPPRRRARARPGVDPATLMRLLRVDAVVAPAENVDLADSGVSVDLERDVPRHGDHEVSDADAGVDGGGAGRQRDGAEIEVELADAELVARLERARRSRGARSSRRRPRRPRPASRPRRRTRPAGSARGRRARRRAAASSRRPRSRRRRSRRLRQAPRRRRRRRRRAPRGGRTGRRRRGARRAPARRATASAAASRPRARSALGGAPGTVSAVDASRRSARPRRWRGRRGARSRFETCHQTSAPPPSVAASQRLPVPGQKRASESARSAPKVSRPTPRRSHGWSRCPRSASTAIDSSASSAGITSHAAR